RRNTRYTALSRGLGDVYKRQTPEAPRRSGSPETPEAPGRSPSTETPHVPVTPALLLKYDRPGPRYTSYPTAVEFHEAYDEAAYRRSLEEAAARRD
ncbi:MAG: hypothetical protein QUU85_16295, partial [Candidatus Eisenbacteria bacterium]|nr:hypothetical protein [Candidatus Eisenbacteria bacterium]